MEHTIDGQIYARICPQAEVPIENATVRIYRPREDIDTTRSASMDLKESFRVLDAGAVEEKSHRHLGDFELDGEGCFVASLREELDYDGEAVQVDLRVEALGGQEIEPVQATLTTIQLHWQQIEEGTREASWDCCLSPSDWCAILEAAGYYVVAGQVTNCETEEPIDGLTVTARDKDIIQPDALGSDTTDANGVYAIYYPESMLEDTPSPFPDIELFGGPDLYFQIDSPGGTPLLEEDPSDGRQPGRENAKRCHCEDLCVDFTQEEGDDPLFTHVGNFNIVQDIDNDGTTNKARQGTAGDGWGFHGAVPLLGFVPASHPDSGAQMYYRFLYRDQNGNETPVAGDLVAPVRVGGYVDRSLGGAGLPGQFVELLVANAAYSPSPLLPTTRIEKLVPENGHANDDKNGWIEVPSPHGDDLGWGEIMKFDTRAAVPGGSGGSATATSGPTSPKSGTEIEVIFETTVDDGSGDPDLGKINRQSETVTLHVNNYGEVRELDVVDKNGNDIGCEVTDTAVVQYNADHEFLREAHVSLSSQASSHSGVTLPNRLAETTINRGSNPPGTNRQWQGDVNLKSKYTGGGSITDFDQWPACTYIARLHTHLALTDGYYNDNGGHTRAKRGAFYKG